MTKVILIIITVLVIVVVLFMAAVTVGNMTFKQKVNREVAAMLEPFQAIQPDIVTEADLDGLPEPVQRWLRYSQVVGKQRAVTVRLKQTGFFRQGPDQAWMPFEAEQYYTIDAPAFMWQTRMQATPFLSITGRDLYYQGHGNMNIKLLSLITVADARGYEIDQGTLLRYLNEIMWFPSAALRDYITWEPIDANAAKATMSYEGVTASADFHFDEQGRLTDMAAERYRDMNGQYSLDSWSTPLSGYGEFESIRVPTKGEGVWHLDAGEFAYTRLEVTEIAYNVPEMYR